MLCLVKVWDAIASLSASALIALSADDGGIEEECLQFQLISFCHERIFREKK
ncbi:hypothetical protein [Nostoc sp.]|uniref:hypothetical protein n=1 Tax=Nostoc sp. TaxID=1180 RepID=UPI002FF1C034